MAFAHVASRGMRQCHSVAFVALAVAAVFIGPAGCTGVPEDQIGPPDAMAQGGFVIADPIDPHAQRVAETLLEEGQDVLAWASDAMVPEDYVGSMRSAGAVLASRMGNDIDRCLTTHQLLSAANIPSRYTIDGDTCTLQALVGDAEVSVPTSRFDVASTAKLLAGDTPSDMPVHRVEINERIWQSGSTAPFDNDLGELSLPDIMAQPVTVDYVDDGNGVQLRVRIGRAGDAWLGRSLDSVTRHALIIRHITPSGEATEHIRTLFDSASSAANQSPDVGVDIYAIWFGASLVGPSYLQIESDLADLAGGTQNPEEFLRLRAIELAVETDNAAWRLFEDAGEDGIVSYDTVRVIIAAQERRGVVTDGPLLPSLDLLANTRLIYGNENPISMQVSLGITDAMVEGMVLERSTGMPALTVPEIFAAHFQEESNDVVSRLEFLDDALQRLLEEGVTEEGLVFSDAQSNTEATVLLVGSELLFLLTDQERAALESAAGETWDDIASSADGVVLGDGTDRAWPIELLLLQNGAALDYVPRIQHVESPQLGLATLSGSMVRGSGSYKGESFAIHAIARMFEESADTGDSESKRDSVDWHLTNAQGVVIGSGGTDETTATLSENKPRILQFGAEDQTSSFYETPLWIAPAAAAAIRAGTPTDYRFMYDTDGASAWVETQLSRFTTGRQTVEIDGQPVGVEVIVATDEDATHQVTIARYGLTRLVLELTTPVGESRIDAIVTPRELRLRGRVMSWRGSDLARAQESYAIGVRDAELGSGSGIGLSWPDGSMDVHVPDTANPTLTGSIAILVDTSNSMDQPADPNCAGDGCGSKIDVVATALETIVNDTPASIELAVWGFPSTFDDVCRREVVQRAPWSLDRASTLDALRFFDEVYLTGGTPLTGAVQAALDEMTEGPWGASRRLIVLADGDNDCDSGLQSVSIPSGIQIYTIGVGLTEGSTAELELMDLASRARGTYTRTSDGQSLSESLTAIGALALPEPSAPETVTLTINADGHLPRNAEWPVDADDFVVYLHEDPNRTDVPGFMVIPPGEPIPTDNVFTKEAFALIEEHRTLRPQILIIAPDRMVDIGLVSATLGWLELDPNTGHTSAVTLDGLHGASPVGTHGAIVAGLWSGVDSVMGGFSNCAADGIEGGPGCGTTASEITASICGSIQADAGTWMTYLGSALGGITSLSNFNHFFHAGASTVEVVCNSGLPGSTMAQVDFSLNALSHGVGALCGALTSNAATLHAWAVCYLVGVGSDIAS